MQSTWGKLFGKAVKEFGIQVLSECTGRDLVGLEMKNEVVMHYIKTLKERKFKGKKHTQRIVTSYTILENAAVHFRCL